MKKALLALFLICNTSILFAQRTYSYIGAIDKVHYNGSDSAFNPSWCPIWEDSSILQRYPAGYGNVSIRSVAAAINPSATLFNDAVYSGEINITASDTFYIDSIYLSGAYLTPNNTGAVSGDRLEISVILKSDTNLYTWFETPGPGNFYLLNALPPTADTILRDIVPFVDPVRPIAGDPTRTRYIWTYNFTNNDTSARSTNGSYNLKRFGFAPPAPITGLPGDVAAVSFTFFSGATWNSTDSISFGPGAGSKNHFRALFNAEKPLIPGSEMSYRNHTENGGGDFCNSSLMSALPSPFFNINTYYPALTLELYSTPAFSYEHLDVDWVISCPSCSTVGLEDVQKQFTGLKVYPNPANDAVYFNFLETLQDEVRCTVYSLVGITLTTTTFEKNQAVHKVNVADLPSGIYVCELSSKDKKQAFRITKQ